MAFALPGPAPHQDAIAEYDYSTGQIVVSYNSLSYWYIESISSGLTGDSPLDIPVEGGLITDTDTFVGESWVGAATTTNLNLGFVAEPGLALGDLRLGWGILGDPFGVHPVIYVNVPEPTTTSLIVAVMLCLGFRRKLPF